MCRQTGSYQVRYFALDVDCIPFYPPKLTVHVIQALLELANLALQLGHVLCQSCLAGRQHILDLHHADRKKQDVDA